MDFITELPLSEGCDQLWVIVDRFTKMAHVLPLRKEGKAAADLAVIFAREVWKYHGLPTDTCQIGTPDSPWKPGRSSYSSWKSDLACRPHSIHKPTARRSGSTR